MKGPENLIPKRVEMTMEYGEWFRPKWMTFLYLDTDE